MPICTTPHKTIIKVKHFINHLQTEINNARILRNYGDPTKPTEEVEVFYETGRKYHRISIDDRGTRHVVYFVDDETGKIFGAGSVKLPNTKWYYGTVETYKLWDWSDWYGIPVKDTSVRMYKQFGPYKYYAPIEELDDE